MDMFETNVIRVTQSISLQIHLIVSAVAIATLVCVTP